MSFPCSFAGLINSARSGYDFQFTWGNGVRTLVTRPGIRVQQVSHLVRLWKTRGRGWRLIHAGESKNKENTVPFPSTLRSRIFPLCFWTISLLTQRPSPVPTAILGGKEGLKDAAQICSRNPRTRVGNGHASVAAGVQGNSARAYPDHALGSRGIDGVRQQVRNDLPNFASDTNGSGAVAVVFSFYADILARELRVIEFHHLVYQSTNIHNRWLCVSR